MRTLSKWLCLTIVLCLVSVAVIRAQDATSASSGVTGSMVTCDADLILSLYVAERYFGFAAAMDMMMKNSTDTSSMVDLTTINKGQFAPLFDAITGMLDQNMMMPGTNMTQEQMQSMYSMMGISDAEMMTQMHSMIPAGTDMSSMTMLNSAPLTGEDASCTKLRTQLNHFYTALVFQDMQTGMGMNSGTGTNTEATPEDTTSASASGTTQNTMNFSIALVGGTGGPSPADPDGTGTAALTVDVANGQICYTLTVQNVALPTTMAHIHRGAASVNGPPVVTFDKFPDDTGKATSCFRVDATLLQEIASDPAGFYVNIHNTEFPIGAVRGQLSG